MNAPVELVCLHPGPRASLQARAMSPPSLGKRQIVVRVQATSVNPIDVKRARGYGRRLMGLIGAGGDAIVLGNDFVGTVLAIGETAREFKVGEAVFGLVPTGRAGGAHRSVLAVDARLARRLPKGTKPHARYAWVVFQPDPGALDAVADMLAHDQIRLGIGPVLPFFQAREAFDYVAQGQSRRAVLVPQRERSPS